MATNPDNAIGTNGAYGGRTSVNALNDVLSVFNGRGVIQGWELLPSAGMTITAGGDGSTRDVAIAEDNIGNKTTINNISEQPVPVDIPAAPASNSRIDLVVAYVDNPPQGTSTATDNYGACGIIVVSGTAAATPIAPEEADIRSAITADGGAGTVAYYVVLGSVRVASGTTDIDSSMITNGAVAGITSHNIDFATFKDSDVERIVGEDLNGNTIYEKTIYARNINFPSANYRIQIFSMSGVRALESITGWIELPVGAGALKWRVKICQEYINASLQKTAATWAYVNDGILYIQGYGAAASSGNILYVTIRYTKF